MPLNIQGERVTQKSRHDAPRLPNSVRGRPNFYFTCLPARWDFTITEYGDNGVPLNGEWLPQLTQLPLDPGVGGVEQPRRTGDPPDPSTAITHVRERKGGVVIHPDDDRLPAHWQNYVQQWHNAGGQAVHGSIWESWTKVGTRVHWQIQEDGPDGVWAFRRFLVEEGIVPEPHPEVIGGEVEKRRDRYQRMLDRLGSNPAHQGHALKVDREKALIELMEGTEPPKRGGKPKRGRKPKVEEPAQ